MRAEDCRRITGLEKAPKGSQKGRRIAEFNSLAMEAKVRMMLFRPVVGKERGIGICRMWARLKRDQGKMGLEEKTAALKRILGLMSEREAV